MTAEVASVLTEIMDTHAMVYGLHAGIEQVPIFIFITHLGCQGQRRMHICSAIYYSNLVPRPECHGNSCYYSKSVRDLVQCSLPIKRPSGPE